LVEISCGAPSEGAGGGVAAAGGEKPVKGSVGGGEPKVGVEGGGLELTLGSWPKEVGIGGANPLEGEALFAEGSDPKAGV
jgi:hypothetical protein